MQSKGSHHFRSRNEDHDRSVPFDLNENNQLLFLVIIIIEGLSLMF